MPPFGLLTFAVVVAIIAWFLPQLVTDARARMAVSVVGLVLVVLATIWPHVFR